MSLSCAPATAVRQVTGACRPTRVVRKQARNWLGSGQATGAELDRVIGTAVASLIEAVGAKDPYTRSHSRRVSRYARAIARLLGLSPHHQGEVALAGELHDVGKIGVPDELLHKTGPLTPEERCRLLDHTVIGERILAPLLVACPAVLAAVRWHHERMDGSGYPDGLRAQSIPLIARILAVADSFDAMTSARPYRPALPWSVAVAELKRGAGTQLDPRCVRAFLALLAARRARRVQAPARALPVGLDWAPGASHAVLASEPTRMYRLRRVGGHAAPRGPPALLLRPAESSATTDGPTGPLGRRERNSDFDVCAHRACRAAGGPGSWG